MDRKPVRAPTFRFNWGLEWGGRGLENNRSSKMPWCIWWPTGVRRGAMPAPRQATYYWSRETEPWIQTLARQCMQPTVLFLQSSLKINTMLLQSLEVHLAAQVEWPTVIRSQVVPKLKNWSFCGETREIAQQKGVCIAWKGSGFDSAYPTRSDF